LGQKYGLLSESMRFSFILALILTISLAGVQWYHTTKYICPIPIEYRLGEIGASFAITESEAKAAIAEAADLWEKEIDEDLFVYTDDADFTINFIFDERQAVANAQTTDRDRLDTIAEQNETFRTEIAQLQSTYEAKQADFRAERDAYDNELQEYNQRVQQINDRGGANPAVFAGLEDERERLERISNSLQREATELNTLAQRLNELGAEGNRLIDTYNQEVEAYNREYGEAHEFTQGDYQGGEINVYKFSDNNELVAVLAHEFGHALGINHIEQEGALMYYLLDDELFNAPTLAASDISAYQAVCEDQGIAGSARSIIRQLISHF
jgi:archaellum component FlaC